MKDAYRRNWKKTLLRSLYIAVIASMVLATALQAASPQGEGSSPDAINGFDDGGAWELGVEGTAGNLTQATAAERYGMYAWLAGWFTQRFSYAEATAWEEDFKRSALGGTENYYLDSVDLMFYVGHGSPANFTFDNASHDDGSLTAPGDCNTSWGDIDNEWLALTSCQVLADTGIGPMAQCMNQQHLILGFVTNASAHNNYWDTQAYHFGRYLRYGYNMTQAWFYGCDVAQRGRTARIIAEETYHFNDNPYYGISGADVYDSDYYWYTHACGTASASYVPTDIMQNLDELPIIVFDPYSTADAQEDIVQLGEAFGVPTDNIVQLASLYEDTDPPPAIDTGFVAVTSTTQAIEVDESSGIYHYANTEELFTESAAQQALSLSAASVNYIDQETAKDIADAFLTDNGLMPSDAEFYEVVADTTGNLGKANLSNGFTVASADDVAQAEVTTNLQVIYTRKISVPIVTTAGIQQELELTVVGPGAKTKVYLPPTGQVNAAGVLQADPLGAQGGWRTASVAVNAATGEALTAEIYNQATAEGLYEVLGDDVTMNSLPIDIKSYEILTPTLAYWESAAGNSQGEMIPVYEFYTRFTLQDDTTTDDFVYVPASPRYLRPLARITDAPEMVNVLENPNLTLTAADATQTLDAANIGADGQFPFVMGANGADGTYTYEWYVNAVDPANKLTDLNAGDGANKITFALPANTDSHESTLNIILVVSDTDSPNESSSTAIAQITLDPSIYLPAVNAVEPE